MVTPDAPDIKTDDSISIKTAVRQKIKDIAPEKGDLYVDILTEYADRSDEIHEELPTQRVLDDQVPWYEPISIAEVAEAHDLELTAENIDVLARAVIYNHFRKEEILRDVICGDADPDRWANATRPFFAMVVETVAELAPYKYREHEEQLTSRLEQLERRGK